MLVRFIVLPASKAGEEQKELIVSKFYASGTPVPVDFRTLVRTAKESNVDLRSLRVVRTPNCIGVNRA